MTFRFAIYTIVSIISDGSRAFNGNGKVTKELQIYQNTILKIYILDIAIYLIRIMCLII